MMVPFNIALRYTFSKKSTNAIQIISGLCIGGMAIGTAALILILSVFNGFEDLLSGLIGTLNADIRITAAQGKFFDPTTIDSTVWSQYPTIKVRTKVLEESVMIDFDGSQSFAKMKAVDKQYPQVTGIEKALVDGSFDLLDSLGHPQAVIGIGLGNKVSARMDDEFTPLKVFAPKNEVPSSLESPFVELQSTIKGVFSIQQDPDNELIIVDLGFGQELLRLDNQISAIELKCDPNTDLSDLQQKLQSALGEKFVVKDRIAQDEAFLKLMNMEKWVSYSVLLLALILIAFNLVGCLWIIVLDKKKDIAILQSMGLTKSRVGHIFGWIGLLYAWLGFSIGWILAVLAYFAHKRFKLVRIPDSFIVDSYPIQLRFSDTIIVFLTISIIGILCSLPAIWRASNLSRYLRFD
ncbi:MAG: ABC transporter permease [Saprospiraceae bacterium]|nr:ABC transporter permease [Saprospiraceae bacterium]